MIIRTYLSKFVGLLLSAIVMLAVSSCGSGSEPDEPAPPVDTTLDWDQDNWDEKDWQ